MNALVLYLLIFVKTCDGKFAPIYSDKRMTTPMANPYIVRVGQTFPRFYTTSRCTEFSMIPERQ